jgi:carbonic anhydrase
MPELSQASAGTAVDRILQHNRAYVARTAARDFPPVEAKRLAVVACYDPRLNPLLLPALGLESDEAFFLRTAGALVQPQGGVMRSLGLAVFMFGVTEIVVVGHVACRMANFKSNEFVDLFRRRGVGREAFGSTDLREWAGAIQDPIRGVQASVRNIASAPYLPKDVAVSGLLFDETTGALQLVERGEAKEAAAEQAEEAQAAAQAAQQGAEEQAGAAQAAATTASAARTAALDDVMAGLDQWIKVVESKAAWKKEVQTLRRDLAVQPGVIARLKRLEAFARKVSGESKEMVKIFEQIKGALKGVPDGKVPENLVRFFQKLAKGPQ